MQDFVHQPYDDAGGDDDDESGVCLVAFQAGPRWVVVTIMAPFCVPIIIRHLLFRVPKKGP